jgi:chaperonin cofactor prefoldin
MNTVPVKRHAVRVALSAGIVAVLALGAAPTLPAAAPKLQRADLEVVDCLLPGQVRVLGTRTYLTQRRPVKTTASDCRIRGGEYVDFDRANLKTALNVWMEAAQAGDAEAQNTVGEIYERGLGDTPNYEAAALWYQKATDQGYTRAMFNLGTLYEQGLGVPADKMRALNLYRQSWGMPEDSVIFKSVADQESAALRAELEKQIKDKDEQMSLLQSQLEDLQKQLAKQRAAAPKPAQGAPAAASAEVEELNKKVESLKKWVASLEAERRGSSERLAALRTPTAAVASKGVAGTISTMTTAEVRKALGVDFGRYYALVIGNQHYRAIDSLQTPISDAQNIAKLLKDRYGFGVTVLEDADDVAMLKALNDLNGKLKPEDNLLIYYAGHGTRLQTGKTESGYWLPVNAEAPPQDTFWVPNEQITAHLARLPARRVLVVADSCYAGLLSTDPSIRIADAGPGYTVDYIKYKVKKNSRLLLSSGGDQPVLDTGGGGNSVFARAFIEELQGNRNVLSAPELFARISKRVQDAAARNKFVQKPEFKSIKGAGHDMGDFFFVPKG